MFYDRYLLPHQAQAIEFSKNKRHIGLFMEMRLRKTATAIVIALRKRCRRILIVSPYSAIPEWQKSLCMIANDQALFIESKTEIIATDRWKIVNKERFLKLPEIKLINIDCIIMDESTIIKNPKAKITKFFLTNFRAVKHRMILTGYPDPISLLDYVCQLNFLDQNLLQVNYWAFRFRYCREITQGFFVLTTQGKQKLTMAISKSCFLLSRKAAGFTEDKVYIERYTKFPPKIQRIYNHAVEQLILHNLSEEEIKRTRYSLEMFSWLRMLCGGFTIEKEFIYNNKLKLLQELIATDFRETQLIIACNYIHEIQKIYEVLHKKYSCDMFYSGKNRERITDFQKGKTQIFICQPVGNRFGLDLSNCNTIIDYSITTGETWVQFHDRIVTINKKETNLILSLMVKNTIDESLYKSARKRENSSKTFRRVIRDLQKTKEGYG